MRFAHIADTHLGYRQYNLDEREEDFYRAFTQAVELIVEKQVDFVVHSGDLFEEPRPHVKALVVVREALEKLEKAEIPFFCIPGNHDMLMRRGAVPPQRVFPQIKMLSPKQPFLEYDGILIAGLPYYSRIHRRAMLKALEEISKQAEEHSFSILMLHQGIDKYFNLEYELEISELSQNFNYFALGHVHRRIVDTLPWGAKLAYPGSTEIWRIEEVEEYAKKGKGFFIVDDKLNVEEVNLTGIREFMDFSIENERDLKEVIEKVEKADKPVITLQIKRDFNLLYRLAITRLSSKVLHLNIRRVAENREIVTPERLSMEDMIRENFQGNKAEKDFCLRLYKTLIAEGEDAGIKLAEDFLREWNDNKEGGN